MTNISNKIYKCKSCSPNPLDFEIHKITIVDEYGRPLNPSRKAAKQVLCSKCKKPAVLVGKVDFDDEIEDIISKEGISRTGEFSNEVIIEKNDNKNRYF